MVYVLLFSLNLLHIGIMGEESAKLIAETDEATSKAVAEALANLRRQPTPAAGQCKFFSLSAPLQAFKVPWKRGGGTPNKQRLEWTQRLT